MWLTHQSNNCRDNTTTAGTSTHEDRKGSSWHRWLRRVSVRDAGLALAARANLWTISGDVVLAGELATVVPQTISARSPISDAGRDARWMLGLASSCLTIVMAAVTYRTGR
jgi:hypothetical protein